MSLKFKTTNFHQQVETRKPS